MWPFSPSRLAKATDDNEPPISPMSNIEKHPMFSHSATNDSIEEKAQKLERKEWLGYNDERLGIIFPLRAMLLMSASFISGASLGAAHGSAIAADRYRAENAHRLPTTRNGWFLYHKSKGYHATLGGMKEGARFGTVLTGWAFLFMATEEIVDQSRARAFARGEDERALGQRDAASTLIAAMSIAGIYSWRQGFDHFAAARTARMALKYSLLYGLVQDALATARGSRPAYIDWIARKTFGGSTRTHQT